jgi:stearoyl-CoA desaturase (delta-9 desaturase)
MEKTQLVKNTFKVPQLWGAIVPMHLFGLYALYLIISNQAPVYWPETLILGYISMMMIGIAAGYHRLFCHKGFEVPRLTKLFVLWLGIIAGQGSPIAWCSIHRGYHHRHPDQPRDLHSPNDGFWHSYILWMFKYTNISIRSTVDLQRDPDMLFAHKYYLQILWVSHLLVAVINFKLWLFLMAFPALFTLHCFLIQTSVTHLSWAGYRNYSVKDNSVNVPWLFPIILGEAWHNNHHGDGRNPNYSRRWWELDPTYWIIKVISRRRQRL